MLEIEKRYKTNPKISIPKDKIKSQYRIEQVYAYTDNPNVRIRKITDSDGKETYFSTIKYILKSGIREEIEQSITQDQYNSIFEVINKKSVIKDRYLINISEGLVAEVDHFIDTNETIIEVEFKDEKTMNDFDNIKPEWIGKEIPNKKSFSVYVFSKINGELTTIQKLENIINY